MVYGISGPAHRVVLCDPKFLYCFISQATAVWCLFSSRGPVSHGKEVEPFRTIGFVLWRGNDAWVIQRRMHIRHMRRFLLNEQTNNDCSRFPDMSSVSS